MGEKEKIQLQKVAFDTDSKRGGASGQTGGFAGEILVTDPRGTRVTCASRNGPRDLDVSPSLSRDGTRLAWMSGGYPDWEVWGGMSDGSAKWNLSRHKGADSSPVISPDGKTVLFVSNRRGDREIYSIVRDDAPWIFLYRPTRYWGVGPKMEGWSPRADGLLIFS